MPNCHILSFLMGFILDFLWGDPHWLPHPIRLMGTLIGKLERRLLGGSGGTALSDKEKQRKGTLLVILVLGSTAVTAAMLLAAAYWLHPAAGIVLESVMTYQILAVRCLKEESMNVYHKLCTNQTEDARRAVSMIVGRDTSVLTADGITKAAVETVAENCSDGAIAPMIYLALGGPVLGFLYKAVNTMDSMIGYENDKYRCFGRTAAKLDDAVNAIPSRISAVLLIVAAFFLGKDFCGAEVLRIFRRDRYNHKSPNAAQTEAVCAGALRIQLAGDAVYFGELVEKPYIGDDIRPVVYKDIVRVNRMLYFAAVVCEGLCLLFLYFSGVLYAVVR